MSRYLSALIVTGLVLSIPTPAKAQCGSDFWAMVKRDFRRNNNWPEPFVRPDREAVALPFGAMINNGWRQQNLISAYHFDDRGHLTLAGEMKVRWIVTQQLPDRRAIFVERAFTAGETSTRIDGVQQIAGRFTPEGELPEVIESGLVNDGWPASEVEGVLREFDKSRASPRLPGTKVGSGGNAGG